MNNRVINAESYIFSAIYFVEKDYFTINDLALILTEQFLLQKTFFKAKAFAYNQIQNLVRKGLLNKKRKKGINQYLYSKTSDFHTAIENIDLIHVGITPLQLHVENKNKESNTNVRLVGLIDKYSSELERISGALEIYQELMTVMPDMKNEFKQLSIEQERKYIRTNEKINTLMKIVGKPYRMI
ncbi:MULTISPECIES: hypothetical protein [Enterobacteriaceae]|uniref:hypothetical protein n=1 Tax=Enterobacteriaceae TaxID=543 RepID=UPI000735688E|nr:MULTISPECIES: hypothetical protein [Enterobacteriaceae]KTI40630.1 hypothetical protein ASV05_07330 [Enterobacter hormaechei subsp. xiangfangensis]KTJ84827.1 hypothetical protein ASU73_22680 [Enterobacter hormaechei subsp. xiangfangensis]MDI3141724.1 hypothetical protein [Enterobacter kobei]MDQ9156130.1 hypothetical protein [Citrobacter portucalensis]MDS0042412.1 hypothetical protein [Enterobacter roggenkampii]